MPLTACLLLLRDLLADESRRYEDAAGAPGLPYSCEVVEDSAPARFGTYPQIPMGTLQARIDAANSSLRRLSTEALQLAAGGTDWRRYATVVATAGWVRLMEEVTAATVYRFDRLASACTLLKAHTESKASVARAW